MPRPAFLPAAPVPPRRLAAPAVAPRLPAPPRLPRALPPPARRPPRLSAATPRPSRPLPPSPGSVPLSLGRLRLSVSGRTLLCLVPLLWASFIACAKLLYLLPRALSPAFFNAARLLVSSLFFLPTLLSELRSLRRSRRPHPGALRFLTAGLELGLLMFCANLAQISGLRYTDASRAAFLNQLSTVFVPLSAALFGLEPLSPRVSLGAACAVAGVALLTLAAPSTPRAALPLLGDFLELLAAVFTTLYVLRVSRHARAAPGKSAPLVAVKVVTQAALSLAWLGLGRLMRGGVAKAATAAAVVAAPLAPWTPAAVLLNVLILLWAGAVVSAATSWMQTKGQSAVPASEAAILYAAQPLWASVIATVALGETLGVEGMVGAGMVVAGTIVSSTGSKEEGD